MLNDLSSITTLLIGETHGVKENVTAVKDIIQKVELQKKVSCIAFEYPRELLPFFEKSLRDRNFEELLDNRSVQELLHDGRFSKEHFNFLLELYDKKVKLLFIDCLDKKWDNRDHAMYNYILSALPHLPINQIMVIVVGDLHLSAEPILIEGLQYVTLGSLFKSNFYSIYLKYMSGSYWNKTLKPFEVIQKQNAEVGLFEKISATASSYTIAEAHPTRE